MGGRERVDSGRSGSGWQVPAGGAADGEAALLESLEGETETGVVDAQALAQVLRSSDAHAGGRRLWRQRLEGGSRDRFIGWSVAQREARLQLVVNNARFLILPWVQVRNLASTVLSRSSRRLPDDWQARYGYRPLLLETFVQSDRFAGTSYRAANWTHVGQTQGRGKLDVHRTHALPRKTSGSTRSGATSAADSALLLILSSTSRTNVYGCVAQRGCRAPMRHEILYDQGLLYEIGDLESSSPIDSKA